MLGTSRCVNKKCNDPVFYLFPPSVQKNNVFFLFFFLFKSIVNEILWNMWCEKDIFQSRTQFTGFQA